MSETTRPIKIKIHIEPPKPVGKKCPGHMSNMVVMPIYSIYGINLEMALKLGK